VASRLPPILSKPLPLFFIIARTVKNFEGLYIKDMFFQIINVPSFGRKDEV